MFRDIILPHLYGEFNECCSLDENQQYTFIDVFNKGKFLTQKDCVSIHSLLFRIPSSGDSSLYQAIEPAQVRKAEMVHRHLHVT